MYTERDEDKKKNPTNSLKFCTYTTAAVAVANNNGEINGGGVTCFAQRRRPFRVIYEMTTIDLAGRERTENRIVCP